MSSVLSIERLWVAISGVVVLRGIALEVPRGGLVALVGRNGAGKTTTLRSVMGLLPASDGRIRLDGTELGSLAAHERARRGIGYMPEDRRLIGPLTVSDNLLLPVWATRLERPTARLELVYHLMPEVKALAGQRAAQLSGGQQRLVATARALMIATRLLLLDEPFEGLSPAFGERLAETIRRARQEGLSILLAESDLKRVAFVDRTLTIERGAIMPLPAAR
jgi:branched-chain amino acid transport system ATP-binding protein